MSATYYSCSNNNNKCLDGRVKPGRQRKTHRCIPEPHIVAVIPLNVLSPRQRSGTASGLHRGANVQGYCCSHRLSLSLLRVRPSVDVGEQAILVGQRRSKTGQASITLLTSQLLVEWRHTA